MLIRDVAWSDLGDLLRGPGIHLDTGAVTMHVRAEVSGWIEQFADLYADYPIDDTSTVVDGRVHLAPTSTLRRIVRPQIQTYVDGYAPFTPHPARFAVPMMESTLNWCVVMSDTRHLMLHSAVVERDGVAVILPVPSGYGKSTLCAALVCRGWRLLSDELAILRTDDMQLLPNPRPISLKNESVGVISDFSLDAEIGETCEGTIKGNIAYMRPPAESVARAKETAMPGLIISPIYVPEAPIDLKPLQKAEGFMWMVENAVNYFALLEIGFNMMARIVDSCPIYRLTYSDLDQATGLIERLHQELLVSEQGARA